MYDVFLQRPDRGKKYGTLAWHLLSSYFTRALREVRKKWDTIEVDHLRVKAKVKITGEFWLQTHEGEGNYNIKRWLEQEDAEVVPPPVAVWLHYLMHPTIRKLEHRNKTASTRKSETLYCTRVERIYRGTYNRFRKALGELAARTAGPGRTQAAGGTVLPLRITRRRRSHADRQGAACLPPQDRAHDLRAFALLVHAEHDVGGRDGKRGRQISRSALRPDRSKGRRRSARAFALPDDPDRSEEAGAGGV